VSVSKPLTRCSGPEWDEVLRRIPARPVRSIYEEGEESARGEIDDEAILDRWDYDWMRRRRRMTEYEWKDVAEFLLSHTVSFVDSELLGGDLDMEEFDLRLRILGEDRSVDGEGRRAIS